MSTKKKRKFVKVTSPVGTAAWARLTEPDKYGCYSITVRMPDAKLEPLRDQMQALLDEAMPDFEAEAGDSTIEVAPFAAFHQCLGKEDNLPTGETELRLKQAAVVEIPGRAQPLRPRIVVIDCATPPKRITVPIGNGSQVQAGFDIGAYMRTSTERKGANGKPLILVGVSARLTLVRVVSLVEEGEADASQYQFEDVQDGYTAPKVSIEEAAGIEEAAPASEGADY